MTSAPKTTSGRRRRASSQKRRISRARWRRFIRFKIKSSPCCNDKCKCGKRRWSLARTSINSASGSAGSIDDRRNLGKSCTASKIWRTRLPSRGLPGKSLPHEVISTPVNTNSLQPLATSRRAASIRSLAGADRLLPRP